jgi:hypothetical protein
MITHIFVAKLKKDAPQEAVSEWLSAARDITVDGMRRLIAGRNIENGNGDNWDVCISADFDDTTSFRRFFDDSRHKRLVSDFRIPLASGFNRVQFERNIDTSRANGNHARSFIVIDLQPDVDSSHATMIADRLGALMIPGLEFISPGPDLKLLPDDRRIERLGIVIEFDSDDGPRQLEANHDWREMMSAEVLPHADRVSRVDTLASSHS